MMWLLFEFYLSTDIDNINWQDTSVAVLDACNGLETSCFDLVLKVTAKVHTVYTASHFREEVLTQSFQRAM